MKFSLITYLTTTALLLGLGFQYASGAKLYKWVDENGIVSYQDTPPPSGSTIMKEEELESSPSTATSGSETAAANNLPVVVFTIENCDSCETLLSRLQGWGVPTIEQSLQDGDIQAEILQSGESLQAPILSIADQFVSNLATDNLLTILSEAGYSVDDSSILVDDSSPVDDSSTAEENSNTDTQPAN